MIQKHSHILLLSLAILVINLFPSFFLIPGTYFLLDTGFAPFTEFRGFFEVSLYRHFSDMLNYLMGYTLWSKMFFIAVIGSGIYMGILLSDYIGHLFPKYQGKLLDIVAILTTIYNPFIYERIISQTGIALGIYLIGIAVLLLLRDNKKILFPTLLLGAVWSIFPHAILLICLILFTLCITFYKHTIKYVMIFLGIIFLNLNWLVGDSILGVNSGISKIESFNRANIEVFQGNSLSGLGVDITHLLGYGFWGERYHIVSPDDIISFWYIFGCIVLGIVIYGGYILYQKNKKTTIALSGIAIIAYILALGIASPIFGWISEILYTHISFYIGMREPQKWLGLTQIVYMIFFVLGGINIIHKTYNQKYLKYLATAIICLLPIVWTPASVIGYWGQLNISDYPDDIFIAKKFIEENIPQDDIILNVPWHSYMGCSWTYGKITANRSSQVFYPANIITSDNIEIGHLYTNSTSSQSRDIDQYIRTKDINLLLRNNIEYILFSATCADADNYVFLEEQADIFTKILDTEHIDIYQINYEK